MHRHATHKAKYSNERISHERVQMSNLSPVPAVLDELQSEGDRVYGVAGRSGPCLERMVRGSASLRVEEALISIMTDPLRAQAQLHPTLVQPLTTICVHLDSLASIACRWPHSC